MYSSKGEVLAFVLIFLAFQIIVFSPEENRMLDLLDLDLVQQGSFETLFNSNEAGE